MQNRYVGDIGDYVKYSLLCSLADGMQLGLAWYLYPDESHNDDGKHVRYLEQADHWRQFNPAVFDAMSMLVRSNRRDISAVKSLNLFPNAVYSSAPLNARNMKLDARRLWRRKWFSDLITDLSVCEIVFADPDNGLCADESFSYGRRKNYKRLPISEALTLADGRPAVFYHHNSRRKGGHIEEIGHWLGQMPGRPVAVYWRAYSPRTFFIANATDKIIDRAHSFVEDWKLEPIARKSPEMIEGK